MKDFIKNDVWYGLKNIEGWMALSLRTVKSMNRRSKLGALWVAISAAVFVSAVTAVYSLVYSMEVVELLPYITVGFITWNFVSGCFVTMPTIFQTNSAYITKKNLPLTLFIAANVSEKVIIYLLQSSVILVVCIACETGFSPEIFILPVSLFLLAFVAFSASYLFATIAVKYRDFGEIIKSSVLLIFLLTPILWKPDFIGTRKFIVDFNPFYHYIHVIREPIIGHQIPWHSLGFTLGSGISLFLVGMTVMARYRHRLVYWI